MNLAYNFEVINNKLDQILVEKGNHIDQDRIGECIRKIYEKTDSIVFTIKMYDILVGCGFIDAKEAVEKILNITVTVSEVLKS